ncbi:MAG: nucleoside phosphorylase [Bacteroidota bacterium]
MPLDSFSDTELILNADGSVYHLNLQPYQVAPTIITVGDPDRVSAVSQHFDTIEHKVQKREFVTHTGRIGDKQLTVISTGIGTGNIDIVFNELDALFNIDLAQKRVKKELTTLQFTRIGTSGCLQKEIPVDTVLVSEMAVGMDNLLAYYDSSSSEKEAAFHSKLSTFLEQEQGSLPTISNVTAANATLLNSLSEDFLKGITLTCPGFYGPQGRQLRAKNKVKNLLDLFSHFNAEQNRMSNKNEANSYPITNFEMETAGIYGMAKLLGHQAISFNALLANRATGEFSKTPKKTVKKMIERVLEKLT